MPDRRGRPRLPHRTEKRKAYYRADYYDSDTGQKKYLGRFKTIKERDAAVLDYKRKLEDLQQRIANKDILFSELCDMYLNDHINNKTEKHKRTFTNCRKRWYKWGWKKTFTSDITKDDIKRFLKHREKQKPIVVNNRIRESGGEAAAFLDYRLLRALFNFAIDEGHLSTNPTKGTWNKKSDRKERYCPLVEDITTTIGAANTLDDRDYLIFLASTGARSIEVNQSKFEDYDFHNKDIALWTKKTKGGYKNFRRVPVSDAFHEMMTRRQRVWEEEKGRGKVNGNAEGYIFYHLHPRKNGMRPYKGPYKDRSGFLRTICKKLLEENKIRKRFTFHEIRHSYLTELAREIGYTMTFPEFHLISGHSEIRTSQRYLHGDHERARKGVSKVAGRFMGAKPRHLDRIDKILEITSSVVNRFPSTPKSKRRSLDIEQN